MTNDTIVSMVTLVVDGRIQNSPNCSTNMTANVHLRVMPSETQAQKIRPTALPMLTMPTMPAATAAVTAEIFWNIGDSCEMREMPAVTLRNSTSQSAHHCQVERASPRV